MRCIMSEMLPHQNTALLPWVSLLSLPPPTCLFVRPLIQTLPKRLWDAVGLQAKLHTKKDVDEFKRKNKIIHPVLMNQTAPKKNSTKPTGEKKDPDGLKSIIMMDMMIPPAKMSETRKLGNLLSAAKWM